MPNVEKSRTFDDLRLKILNFVLILGFAIWVFPSFTHASPPPGTYELYNGEGQRTGLITSTITKTGSTTNLTVITTIDIPGVIKTYHFSETEKVELSSSGVISFLRETIEEGKKSTFEGNRDGKNLVVRTQRDGVKMVAAFPLSTFDMTEFEMDLPGSTFRKLKPSESKSQKVLFLDRMLVIPVSRNVGPLQKLPTNDGEAPVLILNTVINGKPTTSWFHATTGDLLQEEGPDYLMTRVHP